MFLSLRIGDSVRYASILRFWGYLTRMKAHGTTQGALPWLPAIRWLSLVRGVLALGLGFLVLEAPDDRVDTLVVVLAIYLLADGGLTLLEGLQRIVHSGRPFAPYLFEGLVSVSCGWLGTDAF